ncbi:MAG: hypothetical protein ACLRVU_09685 [Beduini sp.]|uniref:hypothetical protein n=1 Tax=Beduini sp. TaxID=1922300 RepID=UPI0039A00A4F
MRSICNIDYANPSNIGASTSASDQNEIIVSIQPLIYQTDNLRVELSKSNGTIIKTTNAIKGNSDLIWFTLPAGSYTSTGTIRLRLLSDQGNSSYVTFNTNQALSNGDNVYVGINALNSGFEIVKYTDYHTPQIIDNLTSTSGIDALSANQGRILNESKEDRRSYRVTVDLTGSSYNTNTYYPVVLTKQIPSNPFIFYTYECNVKLNSGSKPPWSTHSGGFTVNLKAHIVANGWGVTASDEMGWLEAATCMHCNGTMPAFIQQINQLSTVVFYLRGGGRYYLNTPNETGFNIYTVKTNVGSATYPKYVEPTTSPTNSYKVGGIQGTVTKTSGTVVEFSKDSGGYLGFSEASGNYLRTPIGGLLPTSTSTDSQIGTSSWQFKSGYFKNLFLNGTNITTLMPKATTSNGFRLYTFPSGLKIATWSPSINSGNFVSWGTVYESTNYIGPTTLPTFFSRIDYFSGTFHGELGLWTEVQGQISTTKTPYFYACRPSAQPSQTISFKLIIVGG